MANKFYPLAKARATAGGLGYIAGNIKIILLGTSYAYNDAHEFVDDLTDEVARSGNLASKTNTGGVLDAADVLFVALTGGTVNAIALVKDTGSDATSELILYIDSFPDFTPDGSDTTVQWHASGIGEI